MRPRQSEDYERALGEIHAAASSLSQLVAALLFLARADSGATLIDRETIQLVELLEAVSESLTDTYPDIHLEVEGQAQVCGDITLLTRLFTNLLENAAVHGQATSVKVAIGKNTDQILIELSDNGCGLQSEQLPRLLERFYQGDLARRGQGAGLGLSICLSIVHAHGRDLMLGLNGQGGLVVTQKFPALIDP